MAFENTAHDPLARAKLVAVDNGKINDREKQVRRRACESAKYLLFHIISIFRGITSNNNQLFDGI